MVGTCVPAYAGGKSCLASPSFNTLPYVQNLDEPQFNGKIFVNDRHGYDFTLSLKFIRAKKLKKEIEKLGLLGKEKFDDNGQLRVVLTGETMNICLHNEFERLLLNIGEDRNKAGELLISFDTVWWAAKGWIKDPLKLFFSLNSPLPKESNYIVLLKQKKLNYRIYCPNGEIKEEILNDSGKFQVAIRLFKKRKHLLKYVTQSNGNKKSFISDSIVLLRDVMGSN